jgi:alanine-synthesizing transaminase
MFSSRVSGHRATNQLARAVAAHRRAARPLLDLTVTNPTTAGIDYPPGLLAPLADPAALTYAPDPFGLPAARQAVARDYARRGPGVASRTRAVDPDRILLTASTSEAYSLLFKLLCEPAGDDVLVPVPSYPLFDHLTVLDGVRPVNYGLEYHGRWELDLASVDAAWTGRTRAVLAVSPNNPTGSVLSAAELQDLDTRCRDRDAALIVDEVFADYPLHPASEIPAPPGSALTFRLGGLSKSAGLPQVKLGWILVEGPAAQAEEALGRLELIADTYLSVSTPVQVAAASLIDAGAGVRARIQQRVAANYEVLRSTLRPYPALEVLHADAGWAAVIRVPAHQPEETVVLGLLDRFDTLVHPGFFFDFPHEAFLVVSLLPDPAVFTAAAARLVEYFDV